MPSEPILRRRVNERELRSVNCAEGSHADSLRVSDTVVKQPSE
ncbi:MAG: hypothetical protein M0T74_18705 [Desulfitobacterium hafniense]|nr:hypothetical protein [Desulfitobacterium hafniense]